MLTKRQKEVLDFIKKYGKEQGYSPSLEEMRRELKLASVSTVHFHVSRLEALGYLDKQSNKARAIDVPITEKMLQVPLVGTIAAGRPIEALEDREELIAVTRNKLPSRGKFYALKVKGNSMIDENINDGDIILVKHQATAINGDKIVALIDNQEATLKKFYKERGHIRLQPANKYFEPIIIRKDRDFVIQGIVIDIIRTSPITHPSLFKTKIKKDQPIKEKDIRQFLNKVIEGDCLEVMKSIPSKSIDMILCDLPYGTTQNYWDSVIPLGKLWHLYERIIKDNGVIVLTGQGLFTANLMLSNQKLFKYKITWVKSKPTNFLNAKKQPLRKHEDICIFYKSQPVYTPQMTYGEPYNKGFRKDQLTGSYGDFKTVEVKSDGQRYPTDVVYFKTAESEGRTYHPTQKPVELGRYFIRTFTKQGDIILDNTCGSGSFLVSAILEGRNFIGIEKNQEVYLHKKDRADYIEVCKKRIKEAELRYKKTENKLL